MDTKQGIYSWKKKSCLGTSSHIAHIHVKRGGVPNMILKGTLNVGGYARARVANVLVMSPELWRYRGGYARARLSTRHRPGRKSTVTLGLGTREEPFSLVWESNPKLQGGQPPAHRGI